MTNLAFKTENKSRKLVATTTENKRLRLNDGK